MRSDYALYIVAVIFFVITAVAFALELAELERSLWVITTTVLGLLFVGIGYTQKPKAAAVQMPPAPPPSPSTPPTVMEVMEEKKETVVETAPPKMEITHVKGIKEKRAAQLKALGINSVEDLANASAKDLAKKLKISPKITGPWIENAKSLIGKS